MLFKAVCLQIFTGFRKPCKGRIRFLPFAAAKRGIHPDLAGIIQINALSRFRCNLFYHG